VAIGNGLESNAKHIWSLLRRLAHPDFPRFDEQDNLFGAVLWSVFFIGSTGGLALIVGWLLQFAIMDGAGGEDFARRDDNLINSSKRL
jgi:hypothetical protein